jgi:hypothetical protein
MISCDDCDDSNTFTVKNFIINREAVGFYEWCNWSTEKGLERLVFQVSRKSNYLEAHMERIYYCFQHLLDEQLFGALVDFLAILNRNGLALSKRMIIGSKSMLTEAQLESLLSYLKDTAAGNDQLPTSCYSVFSKGLQSTTKLLQINENSDTEELDPLVLARDYIEFSQLDEAVLVLEQAILAQPDRVALHDKLLMLFRSTRDATGFNRVYEKLSRNNLSLPPEWKQLSDSFNKTK